MRRAVILIGENINIVSTTLGPAFKKRTPGPVQEMVRAQVEAGMDYLDLNIGPARRAGEDLMEWVVKTVRDVTDKPLSLDTTNPAAIEAGLRICGDDRALVNSISLVRMEAGFPLVKRYGAEMIGLLWGREGMPRDAAERGMIAAELVYEANKAGIPNEDIWLDPIVTPASSADTNQVQPCLEFMSMLQDIAPGCKSTVGLSNVSNGTPKDLRPYLNRTYLMMLMKYGLHSAIVDAFDSELIEIARGRRPDLVDLVQRLMDGEGPDLASLDQEETRYAKTVRVLTGESLYSVSWLEV
ncbi:MAG: dihydropteroate synthase [Dehalococcoidales bacterium]|nr:dihydropteroate synthase [Dehalococcoidales bacterium]